MQAKLQEGKSIIPVSNSRNPPAKYDQPKVVFSAQPKSQDSVFIFALHKESFKE